MMRKLSEKSGFTLVELAIVIVIISIVAGTIMLETVTGASARAQEITIKRMTAIEQSLYSFYKSYLYIPCPAPGNVALDSAAFGRDTAGSGNCPSDTNAYIYKTNVIMGSVPVKTLNLPDEYALDGWGRRISYMVDLNYTRVNSFPTSRINVRASTVTAIIATYPALLISYGKSGNGAFPADGSTPANRIWAYSGNGNTNEKENAAAGSMADMILRPFAPDLKGENRFDQIVKPISLD